LKADKLFFIYVAKNHEWQQMQKEDWDYVHSMSRFYHWWIRRYLDFDISVEADILPVIPGKIFDRMSINYLTRDHQQRGKSTYHFYLAYFKPFWTDCNTEGYSANNFGMVYWKRLQGAPKDRQEKYFADTNCAKVSHVLSHEIIRMKGKKKKDYFEAVHELWDKHVLADEPYLYFNELFHKVDRNSSYRFVTLNPELLPSV
jgi:hypothetical protein